jgi:hypothetical protein
MIEVIAWLAACAVPPDPSARLVYTTPPSTDTAPPVDPAPFEDEIFPALAELPPGVAVWYTSVEFALGPDGRAQAQENDEFGHVAPGVRSFVSLDGGEACDTYSAVREVAVLDPGALVGAWQVVAADTDEGEWCQDRVPGVDVAAVASPIGLKFGIGWVGEEPRGGLAWAGEELDLEGGVSGWTAVWTGEYVWTRSDCCSVDASELMSQDSAAVGWYSVGGEADRPDRPDRAAVAEFHRR